MGRHGLGMVGNAPCACGPFSVNRIWVLFWPLACKRRKYKRRSLPMRLTQKQCQLWGDVLVDPVCLGQQWNSM